MHRILVRESNLTITILAITEQLHNAQAEETASALYNANAR
jgi:hypothetical protein